MAHASRKRLHTGGVEYRADIGGGKGMAGGNIPKTTSPRSLSTTDACLYKKRGAAPSKKTRSCAHKKDRGDALVSKRRGQRHATQPTRSYYKHSPCTPHFGSRGRGVRLHLFLAGSSVFFWAFEGPIWGFCYACSHSFGANINTKGRFPSAVPPGWSKNKVFFSPFLGP